MVTRILHYLAFAAAWLGGAYFTLLGWMFGGFVLFPALREPYADAGTEQFYQVWLGLQDWLLPGIMTAGLILSGWLLFKRRAIPAFATLLVAPWGVLGFQILVQDWLSAQPVGAG